MDASLYFRLTDRIRAAASLDEVAQLASEIDVVDAHDIERRALRKHLQIRRDVLDRSGGLSMAAR
jgi:hypothetical protein